MKTYKTIKQFKARAKYLAKNYNFIISKYNEEDYSINVDGDVDFSFRHLTELPIKFNIVTGNFCVLHNSLTSLEGAPKYVGGFFSCYRNDLTSLEGCPEYVGGDLNCAKNQLTSLKGVARYVGGGFNCGDQSRYVDGQWEELISIEDAPEVIRGQWINLSKKLRGRKQYKKYLLIKKIEAL